LPFTTRITLRTLGGSVSTRPRITTLPWRGVLAAVVLAWSFAAPAQASSGCAGDCGGDGDVAIDELLSGVDIALGLVPFWRCPAFDGTGDGAITIDEIVIAVRAALNGCPATPTPSRTGTGPRTETPTATPTLTVNHPPGIPARAIYRAYPGYEISVVLGAVDAEGDTIRCAASGLPNGAALDAATGVFTWTPRDDQLGPYSVPFTCTDAGVPPLSANGVLLVKVSPPNRCGTPVCDPETGCGVPLPPVTESCCDSEPTVRVAEPDAGCPEGRVLFVGRNILGFGRMQDCDTLRILNFAQVGAIARFNVEARCLNATLPMIVHARMETEQRLLFDLGQHIQLERRSDGFVERHFVTFAVGGPAPYFDLQDAEANLHVTITDADNTSVEQSLRLKLTFTPIPDLPESNPTRRPTTEPGP